MTTATAIQPRDPNDIPGRHGATSHEASAISGESNSRSAGMRIVSLFGVGLYLGFFLLPIAFLAALTFKTRDEVLLGRFLTSKPTLENWWKAFEFINLTGFIYHSLLIAGLSAILTLAVATPATYAVARLRHGEMIGSLALSTYIPPPIVALLPLFFLMRWLGLLNTFAGMIVVYGFTNAPVAYWLLRGFIKKIPAEIDEAAWIDGAGYIKTFFMINLPLLTPGMAAAGLISMILAYNEFLFASLFAQDDSVRGLTVAISLFQGDRFVNFGQMAVASLVGIFPIYLIGLFFQRHLVGGLTAGGVK